MLDKFKESDRINNDLQFNHEAYLRVLNSWPSRGICPFCGKEAYLESSTVRDIPKCRNKQCQGKKIRCGPKKAAKFREQEGR